MENNVETFSQWLLKRGEEKARSTLNVTGDFGLWLKGASSAERRRYTALIADYAIEEGVVAEDNIQAAIAKIGIGYYAELSELHEEVRLSMILESHLRQSTSARSALAYEIENIRQYVIPVLINGGYTHEQIWKMAEQGWSKFKIASTRIKNVLEGQLKQVVEIDKLIENAAPDELGALHEQRESLLLPTVEQKEIIAETIELVQDRRVSVAGMREAVYQDSARRRPKALVVAGQYALVPLNPLSQNVLDKEFEQDWVLPDTIKKELEAYG